jgi:hypothetical protein
LPFPLNTDARVQNGTANIVPADANSIAFARTPGQVANIVFLGGANNKGGFFPSALLS